MRKLMLAAAAATLLMSQAASAQEGTAAGVAGGAAVGAVVGGPVGAVVGAIAGGTMGTAIDPPEAVRTYVVQAPGEPVMLEGEVALGATLPEVVELHPVPDYDYRFAYVNGQRVLVDPANRQIVYIVQ